MTRAIEIGAMILGSASLLLVSFLGFAVMSGVPLNEIAVIGDLFATPEPPRDTEKDSEGDDSMDMDAPPLGPPKPTQEVVASTMGLMSAYGLPSPYTQAELQELADELKGRAARLDARSIELDERELTLEELEGGYEQKLQALQDMQNRLDNFQRELLAREREVMQAEQEERLSDERKYAEIARVLSGFEGERRNQLLVQYDPDEAALILLALTEDVRTETLSGLSDLVQPEKMRAYVEAYSAAAESRGR